MNGTNQQAENILSHLAYSLSNTTIPLDDEPITVNVFWKYTFGIIMGIMSVLSVFENVVLLMNHTKRVRPASYHIRTMALVDLFTAFAVGPLYAYYLSKNTLIHDTGNGIKQYYFITVYLSAFAFSATFLNVRQRSYYLRTLQKHRIAEILYSVLFLNWFIPVMLSLMTLISDNLCKDVVFLMFGVFDVIVIAVYVVLFVVSRGKRADQKKRFEIVFMKKQLIGRDTPVMFLSTRTS